VIGNPKRAFTVQLYVPEDFGELWEEFKKICIREGESMSSKIYDFVRRYVEAHKEGNPQLVLNRFFEVKQPVDAPRIMDPPTRGFLEGLKDPDRYRLDRKLSNWVWAVEEEWRRRIRERD